MKLEAPPHLEHLIGLRHLFRRLYLHVFVWSGSRNRYIEELMVFQACDRGARISMDIQEGPVTYCVGLCDTGTDRYGYLGAFVFNYQR